MDTIEIAPDCTCEQEPGRTCGYHAYVQTLLEGGALAELSDRDRLAIDLYAVQKRSLRQVAVQDGRSYETIRKIMEAAGVLRHPGEVTPGPPPNPEAIGRRSPIAYRPDPETRERLERCARMYGASLNEIIDSSVKRYLKSLEEAGLLS